MSEHIKPVKVTISDPETGAILEEKTISNDYIVVTAGRRYIKHVQVMGKTHTLSIAMDRALAGTDVPQPPQLTRDHAGGETT